MYRSILVLFGFASCGMNVSFLSWKSQTFIIIVRQVGFFSVPLPAISDYLSPDHISCMKGGVSSAIAAFRAPARTEQYNLI